METNTSRVPGTAATLPRERGLFYGGRFHPARSGRRLDLASPANGEQLGQVDVAGPEDVKAAVAAARTAFPSWAALRPGERAEVLRGFAGILRSNAEELALIDAVDGGNPVTELVKDVRIAAAGFEFFAGLATEAKGETVPMGDGALNYTPRQPWGVVAKIIACNHPTDVRDLAGGGAARRRQRRGGEDARAGTAFGPTADGDRGRSLPARRLQCSLRRPGDRRRARRASRRRQDRPCRFGAGRPCRAARRGGTHRALPAGMGGKNALIAYPDADSAKVARGVMKGMNFAWCGQSCGSTGRAFLHASIHDAVVDEVRRLVAEIRPGLPTDPATRMGALISRAQLDKVVSYIESAKAEGARLVCGGGRPADPVLACGYFVEPTVVADVNHTMRIAREEIFGPVLSVLRWEDEGAMFEAVNGVEYGLTASIWTRELARAHRAAARVQVGFVWVNNSSDHFLGVPFGGVKQSGLGREEGLDELLAYTQVKGVTVSIAD